MMDSIDLMDDYQYSMIDSMPDYKYKIKPKNYVISKMKPSIQSLPQKGMYIDIMCCQCHVMSMLVLIITSHVIDYIMYCC